MLAAFGNANTSDRQEGLAADRDFHWKEHRRCLFAARSGVPLMCRDVECCVHRFHQRHAMLHVANFVANAGRIESGQAYKFYAEGVTPAVARLYEAINAERVAVAAALGAPVPTLADWFERTYRVRGRDLVESCQLLTTNPDGPYQATGTPKSLDHKY